MRNNIHKIISFSFYESQGVLPICHLIFRNWNIEDTGKNKIYAKRRTQHGLQLIIVIELSQM